MSDFLLGLASNSAARAALGALGLPLPAALDRDNAPWRPLELAEELVAVGFSAGAALAAPLAAALAEAGARSAVLGEAWLPAFQAAGEAWSRPPAPLPEDGLGEARPRGLVFDATGLSGPAELRALYDFFHPRVRGLLPSGRAIVIGRPAEEAEDPAQAAARRALEGFVRSLGRELGRRGSTAHLITVAEGADDRLGPLLRFLLSPRSAFVSGQPWALSTALPAEAPRWLRPLEGQVALVTGAARGIGAATAAALAREGAKVVVLDLPRDDGPGSKVAAAVGGSFLACDLTEAEAPEQVKQAVQERFGRLDILVNNAGVTRDKTLGGMKPEAWDLPIAVNLTAVLRLTEALAPLMGPGGRILCLSSIAGIAGNVGQTSYSASKAGILGYVPALAKQLAPRGVAVNGVAPGFIETRLTAAIPVATREVARRLANLAQGGLPEDIAEVITFFASPGASGLSGQVIRVCGGSFVGA